MKRMFWPRQRPSRDDAKHLRNDLDSPLGIVIERKLAKQK